MALAAAAAASAPPFRFSRMGPNGAGKQLGEPNRKKIGEAMTAAAAAGSQIPAGFTYLGQFIDHDLTFDKTTVMLGRERHAGAAAAGALAQPRPRLAVRRRAADPESAKFYEADGLHLKMGKSIAAGARPRTASTCRAARATRSRRSAGRSSPTRATTRTSPSPRRTRR